VNLLTIRKPKKKINRKKKKSDKKKEEKSHSSEVVPHTVISLKPYLSTDWSQQVKHLRIIILETRNIVPLKSGPSTLGLILTLEPEAPSSKYQFPRFMTSWQPFQQNCNPAFRNQFEFREFDDVQEAPIKICVWETKRDDEKLKEGKLLATLKLNLSRQYSQSLEEGGGVVENWYKTMTVPEELDALKKHGVWWGVKQTSSVEVSCRFIAFS